MQKAAVLTLAMLTISASAFAWPGGRMVSCHSLPRAKKKVSVVVQITGSGTDDMPAGVELTIDGASVKLDDPDRNSISIISHLDDKALTASYRERDNKHETSVEIWAKPATIKGHLDKQTCQANYTFRAGFSGGIATWSDKPEDSKSTYDEGDTLECEYGETFGSAGC